MTIKIGEQLNALDTATNWLKAAGATYLPKTYGVRARELDYVLQGLVAVQGSLEWLSQNRSEFELWLAEKKVKGTA